MTSQKLRKKFKRNGLNAYHSKYTLLLITKIILKGTCTLHIFLDKSILILQAKFYVIQIVLGNMTTTDLILLCVIILDEEGIIDNITNSIQQVYPDPPNDPAKKLYADGM